MCSVAKESDRRSQTYGSIVLQPRKRPRSATTPPTPPLSLTRLPRNAEGSYIHTPPTAVSNRNTIRPPVRVIRSHRSSNTARPAISSPYAPHTSRSRRFHTKRSAHTRPCPLYRRTRLRQLADFCCCCSARSLSPYPSSYPSSLHTSSRPQSSASSHHTRHRSASIRYADACPFAKPHDPSFKSYTTVILELLLPTLLVAAHALRSAPLIRFLRDSVGRFLVRPSACVPDSKSSRVFDPEISPQQRATPCPSASST